MKKPFRGKLISLILSIIITSAGAFASTFSDVPQGFWAYKQIDKMTDAGIIGGYSGNKFRPQKYVTRAEYAAMIIKAIEAENIDIEKMYTFDDISNKHWAWNYVIRAVNLDILTPADSEHFNPDGYITRADVITFLVNILKSEDITKKEAIKALQNAYLDFDDIPDWFKVTAGKAEVLNVIAKTPEKKNYLDCDSYVTRAQAAVFLYNLKDKISSYKEEERIKATTPKTGEGIVIKNIKINGDVAIIPPQTVLPISVTEQLNTKYIEPGQMFGARLTDNITDENHNIILPKEITLTGRILDRKRFSILIDISAANKNNNSVTVYGLAECKQNLKSSKFQHLIIDEEDIIYIKLYRQMRINIVTGEILD